MNSIFFLHFSSEFFQFQKCLLRRLHDIFRFCILANFAQKKHCLRYIHMPYTCCPPSWTLEVGSFWTKEKLDIVGTLQLGIVVSHLWWTSTITCTTWCFPWISWSVGVGYHWDHSIRDPFSKIRLAHIGIRMDIFQV